MSDVEADFIARYRCKCGYWQETGYASAPEAQRGAKTIVLEHLTATGCQQDSDLWELELRAWGIKQWPGDVLPARSLPLPKP